MGALGVGAAPVIVRLMVGAAGCVLRIVGAAGVAGVGRAGLELLGALRLGPAGTIGLAILCRVLQTAMAHRVELALLTPLLAIPMPELGLKVLSMFVVVAAPGPPRSLQF